MNGILHNAWSLRPGLARTGLSRRAETNLRGFSPALVVTALR